MFLLSFYYLIKVHLFIRIFDFIIAIDTMTKNFYWIKIFNFKLFNLTDFLLNFK